MGFEHKYRLSAHAVITNETGQVLQIRQSYGDGRWGLPGGGLEPGETIHEALRRECREELGLEVEIDYLSGVYFHAEFDCHAFIFRCTVPSEASVTLSTEHLEHRFFDLAELSDVQRQRVEDCLRFEGHVRSASFGLIPVGDDDAAAQLAAAPDGGRVTFEGDERESSSRRS